MRKLIAHQYCYQLTAVRTRYPLTSITWPYLSRSSILLKLSADKLLVFKWSQAHFFKIYMKYVVFMSLWPSTINIFISNWHRTREFSQLFKNTGGKDRCFSLFSPWSRSTSNFYALIGQNLTGEFMRKIYAASWILFTLTAEADRVLCQLVMFLTVFFHWMYKMKCSCYQESSVIHGCWFVYWIFGWGMLHLSKSEIWFRIASFLFFTLLDA